MSKLDYKKMLTKIDAIVADDFLEDMSWKTMESSKPYTQEDAKEMAQRLGAIYTIAHAIHCTACQSRYLLEPRSNDENN